MKQNQPNYQENIPGQLLNFLKDIPKEEFEQINMRPMKPEQFGSLKKSDELLGEQMYTYSTELGGLWLQRFALLPNILIQIPEGQKQNMNRLQVGNQLDYNSSKALYLILSNCMISKRTNTTAQLQSYCIQLSNSIGNMYLIFQDFFQYRRWYKQLKQYCQLTKFLETYKLGLEVFPGFYNCVKKKNSMQFTVQIYKLDEFERCSELEEVVHNEIHILRSIKHQGLLEIRRVYQNIKYLFILYDHYKGESLFKLLNTGLQLHEVQTASEYRVNDKLDFITIRSGQDFIAPEFSKGVLPSIKNDIYGIGCLLYFMSLHDQSSQKTYNDHLYKFQNKFKIDYNLLTKYEKELQLQPLQQQNKISVSQIDLLKKLLEQDPDKRISIKEATKHHWFVNVKSKIKQMKTERKGKKPLPQLRTIIELKEQSDIDIRLTIIQQNQSGFHKLNNQSQYSQQSNKQVIIQEDEFDEVVPEEPELNLQLGQFVRQKTKLAWSNSVACDYQIKQTIQIQNTYTKI